MLTIQSFTAAEPDSDGDMNLSLRAELLNNRDQTIGMIRTQAIVMNAEGTVVATGGRNDELLRLDSGDSTTVEPSFGYVKEWLTGSDGSPVTAKVFVTTFTRVHTKLGDVHVPSRPNTPVTLVVPVASGPLAPEVRVVVFIEQDSDGEQALSWRCAVTNASAVHIPKVVLTTTLVDEEDAPIETSTSEIELSGHLTDLFDDRMWGVKKSQLRRAQLRFALSAFLPIETFVATAAASADEDA